MRRAFVYRLYPTKRQRTLLNGTLEECRWLYNHLLAERKDAYQTRQETLTRYGQQAMLPALKAQRPALREVYAQVLQDVAVRVDLAMQAFFRRVKTGEHKPGYPRFRGRARYDSFCYPQSGRGFALDASSNRLVLSKIGHVKAVLHRPTRGTIKTCSIKCSSTGKWYAIFSCDEVPPDVLPPSDEAVGISLSVGSSDSPTPGGHNDLGGSTGASPPCFAVLSTGEQVAAPHFVHAEARALGRAQRRLRTAAVEERGNRDAPQRARRRKVVARIHERIRWRRADFVHQQSRRLVDRFGILAVQDVSVERLLRDGRADRAAAKGILDAAWGTFVDLLLVKAESAGRVAVRVPEADADQTCSRCGAHPTPPPSGEPASEKLSRGDSGNLVAAVYRCLRCGLALPRAHNAALSILGLGQQSLGHAPSSSRR